MLPEQPNDSRIVNSTGALEIDPIPSRFLVIGGGIIGLEMACVYSALGSKVTIVELADQLMPGTDEDLVKPLLKTIEARYEKVLLRTKVNKMTPLSSGIEVTIEKDNKQFKETFDKVLVAVGRRPNTSELKLDKAGVNVNHRGLVEVDKKLQTNVSNIFALGDIVSGPMLAHKATHEAKVAAEVIAGKKSMFDARVIPSVAYTDPEIAWVGVTESQALNSSMNFEKAYFPWAASGRALSQNRTEGMTKLLFDKENNQVIGGGIVGPGAGDLISEVVLAIEMNADATDVSRSIHPHPTLAETVGYAAEAFEGTLTDLYMPGKKGS